MDPVEIGKFIFWLQKEGIEHDLRRYKEYTKHQKERIGRIVIDFNLDSPAFPEVLITTRRRVY